MELWGERIDVKEYDRATGRCLVEVSEDFYRPTDVVNLWGDPTKVRAKLRWNPNTIMFEELARIMEEADVAKVAAENAAQYVCTNLAEYLKKRICEVVMWQDKRKIC